MQWFVILWFSEPTISKKTHIFDDRPTTALHIAHFNTSSNSKIFPPPALFSKQTCSPTGSASRPCSPPSRSLTPPFPTSTSLTSGSRTSAPHLSPTVSATPSPPPMQSTSKATPIPTMLASHGKPHPPRMHRHPVLTGLTSHQGMAVTRRLAGHQPATFTTE